MTETEVTETEVTETEVTEIRDYDEDENIGGRDPGHRWRCMPTTAGVRSRRAARARWPSR